MKDRIRAFFAILIVAGLCVLSIYLGSSIFRACLSFEDNIVFSWLAIALISLPVVMIFPLVYFILVLIKEKDFAFKNMDNYVHYLKTSARGSSRRGSGRAAVRADSAWPGTSRSAVRVIVTEFNEKGHI